MDKKDLILSIIAAIVIIILFYYFHFYEPIKSENSGSDKRKYISRNLEKCRLINFLCAEGEKVFFDDTGCGCEPAQPNVCPQDTKTCPDGEIVSRNPNKDCEFDACPSQDRHFCTPEEREAEFCIEIFQPVCGWFDPERVQCIKYPCAVTHSNSCFACQDEDVLYWTVGECPTS